MEVVATPVGEYAPPMESTLPGSSPVSPSLSSKSVPEFSETWMPPSEVPRFSRWKTVTTSSRPLPEMSASVMSAGTPCTEISR